MSWTDDRVETLKKLWSEGLSASQIAGRLGGVSRNAVIGKVHRLGLSGRATTTRSTSTRARRHLPTLKRPQRPRFNQPGNPALRALYAPDADLPALPSDHNEIPPHERIPLIELKECSCRWPIGDPQTGEFGFCNAQAVPGLPYCEAHARRAFQPPQARRRDARPDGQPSAHLTSSLPQSPQTSAASSASDQQPCVAASANPDPVSSD
ncbi:MAG: GcrA family cell cycle regulator [Hyphomicrobiaceae bacterium]